LLLTCGCAALDAYVFLGQAWPDGSIVMDLQLGSSNGTLTDGATSWGQSAEGALATWNNYLGRVKFTVRRDSTATMASGNGVNNVFWSNTVYGRAFGADVLAVTSKLSRGAPRVGADAIFNRGLSWNSYPGPLRGSLTDFRRVALHEFGHVLGLDHPDEYGQRVASIMNSFITDIDRLQSDDVAGVAALYGGSGTPTTPPPTLTAPNPPIGLTTSSSGSSVFLAWNAPTGGGAPSAYTIEAGSASGRSDLANFSTGSTATSFSAGGVGNGTYYIRVK